MATVIRDLLPLVRDRLIEPQPGFWGDDELIRILTMGIRDLWRDIVDLKQEHYLTIDTTDVSLPASSTTLLGVPADVHKVYLIEPFNLTQQGPNHNLWFKPLPYNSTTFQAARSQDPVDPCNTTLYYAIHGTGTPVTAPTIYVAPQVTSAVQLSFSYVPSLGTLTATSTIPIPGEADSAVVAWTVAFAKAKETDGGAPDANWLQIYATDKAHLLQSLGLRQYQELPLVEAMWSDYWS